MGISSQIISGVYHTVKFVCEGSELLNTVEKIQNSDGSDINLRLEKIKTLKHGLLLGLQASELLGIGTKASNSSLHKIKLAEKSCRIVDLPIQMLQLMDTRISLLERIEKGFISPLTNICRTHMEEEIYKRNAIWDLPEEARKQIPEAQLDKMELNYYINSAILPGIKTTEMALRLGVISKTVSVYQRLLFRLRNGAIPPERQPQVVIQAQPENEDPLNLRNARVIPEEFHNDPVFSRYICSITLAPIRFVVGDPNGRTLYEKSAIENWLLRNPTSPATRVPLLRAQLIQKHAIQSLIDDRLRQHEIQLRAVAGQAMRAPVNQEFQNAANIEMPLL